LTFGADPDDRKIISLLVIKVPDFIIQSCSVAAELIELLYLDLVETLVISTSFLYEADSEIKEADWRNLLAGRDFSNPLLG
jgi:hypothetical protein